MPPKVRSHRGQVSEDFARRYGTADRPRSRTLQQQGVPFPDRLGGPKSESRRAQRTSPSGTASEDAVYQDSGTQRRASSRPVRIPNPVSLGSKSTSGIGLLEGEFFLCIALLILVMFANSQASYPDRIMSLIKRGSLTCLAFFLLALTASIGPNASKIAKALGALLAVTILLTTPVYSSDGSGVIQDVDNIIKNDWSASAPASSGSSNSGTGGTSGTPAGGASTFWQDIQQAFENAAAPLTPVGIVQTLKNLFGSL